MKKALALIALLSLPGITQAVEIKNELLQDDIRITMLKSISGHEAWPLPFSLKPGETRNLGDAATISVEITPWTQEEGFSFVFTGLTDQTRLVINKASLDQFRSLTNDIARASFYK